MKKHLSLGAILITSAIFLSACGNQNATPVSNNGDTTPTSSSTNGDKPANDKPANGGMNMTPQTPAELTEEQQAQLKAGEEAHEPTTLTFKVSGGNFYYAPNTIKVKRGDTVRIVFENAGGMHNLNIDEFNAKTKTIKTGESETIEFVADQVGSFEYYCSIGSHRQMGQKGALIVEE
ncbi:cupredoxin domain-containing protein [Candidatus Peregrinibacteria bacterium]|nr:cupredoxin domain-containing protein [Candidatus Peregrinibacteria bacterium]